jgi:hypothetical protein
LALDNAFIFLTVLSRTVVLRGSSFRPIGSRKPLLAARKAAASSLASVSCTYHGDQVWLHHHAQVGQVASSPATIDKRAAQFRLQLFDGECQGRLIRSASGAAETLLVAEGEKVTDLFKRHHGDQTIRQL